MVMMSMLEILNEAEHGPTPEQIENAPFLDRWWIADFHSRLRAQGDLSGHPDLPSAFVSTSPLVGFDAEAGWLRSRSRFYRLGKPHVLPGSTLKNSIPLDIAQRVLSDMRTMVRAQLN